MSFKVLKIKRDVLRRVRIWRFAPCAIAICAAAADAPHVIEVKPGDSLEVARDAARALPLEKRANGVEVVLAPGVYRRSAALKLDARDAEVLWTYPAPATRDFKEFEKRAAEYRRRLVRAHVNCAPLK